MIGNDEHQKNPRETCVEIGTIMATNEVTANQHEKEPVSARDTHVGESNYSAKEIQPWDVWQTYGLNPWDADILKRIIRTKEVPGLSPKESRIQDYQKIQHICTERIEQINAGDPYYSNLKIPKWVGEQL